MVASGASSVVIRRQLLELLSEGAGVTVVSASAGSGKTILLRSWIEEAGLRDRVAWVSVERDEYDAQRFWISLIRELRAAVGVDTFVEKLEPTPGFAGESVVGRLIDDLHSLEQPVVLVIDDLQELRSPDALRQLELLITRRPPLLRIVLSSRHDPQLGLHRLRVAGELTEIRSAELLFSLDETRRLLSTSGIELSDESVSQLHERTEGWAAGLRLAALALVGHPDPERFVAEFTGSERTVGHYLFAEVLARQPEEARRLLLRTSILERVNGPLADLLTGAAGSQRLLRELEQANAFVLSLDTGRTWFRYHRLFADMLRVELEHTEPDVVSALHRTAADWYAHHGEVVSAIRHFQAAQDWPSASRLLADNSLSLALDGRGETVHSLLGDFPPGMVSVDPELALVFAGGAVWRGAADAAAAHIALAERNASNIPEERRTRFMFLLAPMQLLLARQRGDVDAALTAAQPLLDAATPEAAELGLGNDVRAAALTHLGIVELWSGRVEEAERHLEQALQLARVAGRPWIEVQALAHLAVTAGRRSFADARERALEAVALAEANGWSDRIVGVALVALGTADVWQGRFDEAEHWLNRAEQAVRPLIDPPDGLMLHLAQGRLHAARAEHKKAAAEFKAAAQLEALVVAPQLMGVPARRLLAQTQMRLGDLEGARRTLDGQPENQRDSEGARVARAYAHLAHGSGQDALDDLAPLLNGPVPSLPMLLVEAFLLDAAARDLLDEAQAAEFDVERALELAEPNALVWPFVVTPARRLIEQHPPHRTAHGALLRDILDVIAGSAPSVRASVPAALRDELSDSELRVLRYLPSNLTTPEIGKELYLSFHTVKTHMRHIYAKLGVHRRTEAVERARELGLLAPTSRLR